MESTTLNPTQLFLLQMFAHNGDEEHLKELKEVWLEHIRKKVDEESKRIWVEKNMSEETMDEILNTHLRTPYNPHNCSLTVEIIDQNALILLEGMERLKLIKVSPDVLKKVDWAKKYKGAMPPQTVEEIERLLDELRNAWE